MIFCECGSCLGPNEDILNKIKARFKTLVAPYYLARVKSSRGKRHGDQPWQEGHWKALDAKKVQESIIIPQSWTDGTTMKEREIPGSTRME